MRNEKREGPPMTCIVREEASRQTLNADETITDRRKTCQRSESAGTMSSTCNSALVKYSHLACAGHAVQKAKVREMRPEFSRESERAAQDRDPMQNQMLVSSEVQCFLA